jgi:hypothetical protein
MNRHHAFAAVPGCALRAGRALDSYRTEKRLAKAAAEELIAALLADLAHYAAERGINYGALIACAQSRWLSETAGARPPPKRESPLREKRSSV